SLRMRRWLIVVAVENAKPAAEIDMRDDMTVGTQGAHELRQEREGIVKGRKFGDLAADMHVDAGDLEPGQLAGSLIDCTRPTYRNAKLVFRFPGRNLGMGSRINVRIDAN